MHCALALLLLAVPVHATVWVPAIFSDGMVLQEHATYDQRPFIYGTTLSPNELVTVIRAQPNGHTAAYPATSAATASPDGQYEWIVQLDPDYFPASQNNLTITITGSAAPLNTITIRDVVYGDVFLCGGQSNMNENVAAVFDANVTMAGSYPRLRLFSMAEAGALSPQRDVPAFTGVHATPCSFPQFPADPHTEQVCNAWQPATRPSIIGGFSATCLYTALALQRTITDGRYIGLIHASVSGTGMKLWAKQEAISTCDAVYPAAARALPPAPATPLLPLPAAFPPGNSTLWNAMINPISRFAIRAVLWNQGESDSGEPPAYFSCLFAALIESWRRAWRIGDFAWVFVQLGAQDSAAWPNYYISAARQAQADTLPGRGPFGTDTLGMATAYDLGDMLSPYPPAHVHARNKTEVGRRLALALLHTQYALQYPASPGLINLSTSLNWSPPRLLSATPLPASAALQLDFAIDGAASEAPALLLADTPNCWECCSRGLDTVQVRVAASGAAWVNCSLAVGAGGRALLATPLAPAPPGAGGYTLLRYAPNLWPQCVAMGSINLLPVEPFTVAIGGGSGVQAQGGSGAGLALGSSSTQRKAPAEAALAWTTWKGRAIASTAACTAACTPPMGFNSWNAYHTNVDASLIKRTADTLLSSGLAAAGFRYVNIDDGWQADRYPNGTILADPTRFPLGIEDVANYVHSIGLLFGVYTAQRQFTCQQRPGSWRFEAIDIDTYCRWGVDYVKTDACFGQGWPQDNVTWIDFRAGITRCTAGGGRPMVLSVESCNDPRPGGCSAWIGGLANLWRTTGDIQATFESVMGNLDSNNNMAAFAKPGQFNDPDMLQVGNPGLSEVEARTHFFAWSVVAAPLLIAADLVSGLDAASLAILSAEEVVAVDQDALGVQGVRVSPAAPQGSECWARPLADGGVAALLVNRGGATADATCTFEELGLRDPSAPAAARDLWLRSDLGNFTASFTAKALPSHGSMIVKFRQ